MNNNKWIKPAVIVLVVVIIIAWAAGSYNSLVATEERVESQWAQVENVYQRRADLIPNLVSTVRGYADFERQTLTDVIEARAKATSVNINPENLDASSIQQFQSAQGELSSALSRLMVVVERYPDLKANQNFLELQSQLEGTENRIAVERNRFNDAARVYNTTIRRFPRNLFASTFGFERKPYFEADEGTSQPPRVEF
jgi:LemA protein